MNKDFYEFLYQLRASGFTHNTRENSQLIFYRNSQQAERKTPFHVTADSSGEVTGNNLSGEIGSFSMESKVNFRNTIIGIAFALNMHALDKYVDLETVSALSDYYIQKAESITTAGEFNRTMRKMARDFDELSHARAWESYGQPVDACIDYVYQHLYSRFTVKDIARELKYDASYLSTLFHRHTGQSLYAFIREAKIQEARVLLLYTSQPLTSIASALGYHSLSHFSKAFKAAEGISPLAFRRQGAKRGNNAFYGNSFLTKPGRSSTKNEHSRTSPYP